MRTHESFESSFLSASSASWVGAGAAWNSARDLHSQSSRLSCQAARAAPAAVAATIAVLARCRRGAEAADDAAYVCSLGTARRSRPKDLCHIGRIFRSPYLKIICYILYLHVRVHAHDKVCVPWGFLRAHSPASLGPPPAVVAQIVGESTLTPFLLPAAARTALPSTRYHGVPSGSACIIESKC